MAAFIDKEEATIFKPSGCKLYKIFLIDLINEKIMSLSHQRIKLITNQ